jgi:Beta/Gamma crystallin
MHAITRSPLHRHNGAASSLYRQQGRSLAKIALRSYCKGSPQQRTTLPLDAAGRDEIMRTLFALRAIIPPASLWCLLCATALVGCIVTHAKAAAITLYDQPYFQGQSITVTDDVRTLANIPPWNDRARSFIVHDGNWQVCRHKNYEKCETYREGARVEDTRFVKKLKDGVSSLRRVRRDGGPKNGHDGRDPWYPPSGYAPGYGAPGGIIWNDGREDDARDHRRPLSRCQNDTLNAFFSRYGRSDRYRFEGSPNDGRIIWKGDGWFYRCADGRINIWR